jgi:hypothetical protein
MLRFGVSLVAVVLSLVLAACGTGSISVSPSALTYKATGSQNVTITFSGSGSVGVGPIIVTDTSHFVLEGEEACERTYSSSNPKCTFQVRLFSYVKGLSALVHIETGVGHLQVSLKTE